MESLLWIESNFLVNARKWQEHDVAAESTTGLFGGLSGTTFAVEICLNFQVNRSGELDVSREQTADCNTRDCLRNLCCQFPLFLWRMLPFLTALSIFLFLHLYSTLAFTLSSKFTSRKLPPWTSDLYPYRLLPVSKSAFTLCSQYQFFMHLFSLQPSSYKKIASCFASFNKHWELSTAAWRSLISCGSLPFSWLS